MSIQVGLEDDLSAMLLDNDVDPEVPEGTEYYLPAGSSYRVTPFSLMKGFRLAGSRDGVKPVVVLEGSWSIAEGSYLSSLEFDNIEFRHEANNNYFMNTSKGIHNRECQLCKLRLYKSSSWFLASSIS